MPALTPERTLLEAVRVMHERGFEGLRVHALLHGTGHWRCTLSAIGQPVLGGRTYLRYSSANKWRFLAGGVEEPCAPEQLADRLQAVPGIEATQLDCLPYRVWFRVLLQHIGPDSVPYHADSDGYFDALREGCIRYTGPGGQGEFPLAPIF
jgi:hypothetical protein